MQPANIVRIRRLLDERNIPADGPIAGEEKRYVAELTGQGIDVDSLLSMSEAIRKISLMQAQTLEEFGPQMKKKGRLQVGMDADIAIFASAKVEDKATYDQPTLHAVVFQAVLVYGVIKVDDGKLVPDAAADQPIRRAVAK